MFVISLAHVMHISGTLDKLTFLRHWWHQTPTSVAASCQDIMGCV